MLTKIIFGGGNNHLKQYYSLHPFSSLTHAQKMHIHLSFRCEIYESQIILNLRATELFQLSAL